MIVVFEFVSHLVISTKRVIVEGYCGEIRREDERDEMRRWDEKIEKGYCGEMKVGKGMPLWVKIWKLKDLYEEPLAFDNACITAWNTAESGVYLVCIFSIIRIYPYSIHMGYSGQILVYFMGWFYLSKTLKFNKNFLHHLIDF